MIETEMKEICDRASQKEVMDDRGCEVEDQKEIPTPKDKDKEEEDEYSLLAIKINYISQLNINLKNLLVTKKLRI